MRSSTITPSLVNSAITTSSKPASSCTLNWAPRSSGSAGLEGFSAQLGDGGEVEDLEARADGCEVIRAGIGDLEAARAGNGGVVIRHRESCLLVAAPPPRETGVELPLPRGGGGGDLAVAVVHEESADGAGPGVEVLVRAPCCGVDVPVVQLEGHVADGVGEVPDHEDAAGLGVGGDRFDVEELAGVELDAGEEEDGGGGRVGVDGGEDVGG
ncbi:hypothetical protein V492_04571, partial [Pseudogymnoascus sp. VKM F-4246]